MSKESEDFYSGPLLKQSEAGGRAVRYFQVHWSLLLFATLVLASSFYWFEYRPSQIKQACQATIQRGSGSDLAIEFGHLEGVDSGDKRGIIYKRCLASKGL